MEPLEGKHIGLIPDGNRRWANEKGKKPWEGHIKGSNTLDDFIDWAIVKSKAKTLSIYSLSTDNISKRPVKEINNLIELYTNRFKELAETERVKKHSIKIRFPGNLNDLPEKLRSALQYAKEKTKDNDKHTINFLLPYGGRYEITEAMKSIAQEIKNKTMDLKDITQEQIENKLMVSGQYPDLVIRTAEKRLSNFLLWQTAYSEVFFVDKYWPDFSKEDFNHIKEEFMERKRTYGE